jgi:pilus assembly protein CpaC
MFTFNKSINFIVVTILLLKCLTITVYADADNGKGVVIKKPQKNKNNKSDVKLGAGLSTRHVVNPDVVKLIQGNTAETQFINLPINKVAVLRLPRPSRDVVIANPELMDVVVRSPQEIYLFAKKAGHTNGFIFDEKGQQIVNLEINIGIDVKDLERVFKEQIPDSNIKVTNMADTIILSGNVKSASYAKMARDIAQRLVDSPEKVINNIGVTGQEQVMIKVKVAEMQRTILKQLGIDWNTAFQVGKVAGGFGLVNGFGVNGSPATGLSGTGFNSANILASGVGGLPSFANSGAVETYLSQLQNIVARTVASADAGKARITALQDAAAAAGRPLNGAENTLIGQIQNDIIQASAENRNANQQILQINNQLTNATGFQNGAPVTRGRTAGFQSGNVSMDGLLKALERHSLLKTLAEPNLTALSGESAKFLAGGELPFIVSQNFGQAAVDFKPYGIGLAFTPIVLNEDRISLKVSTEISETTEAVVSGNSSYPGLSVRRAETTVEMPSGGTMAMAGLIRDDTRRAIDSTPGLKEVPVLGPLFRSNDFKSSQSELVVLVTPYLVKPAHESEFSLPTDGFANPSDMDMYMKGRLAAVYDDKNGDTDKEEAKSLLDDLLSNKDNNTHNSDEYIVE